MANNGPAKEQGYVIKVMSNSLDMLDLARLDFRNHSQYKFITASQ